MSNMIQKQAAKQFVKDWMGKGYEKGETQRFWLDLLHNVFGVDDPTKTMQFEIPVKTITKEKGADFIDGYITPTKVLIEQKGSHIDLSAKAKQSDGAELTPYQQARRYATGLPLSMAPRWIVACNFTTFEIHDMERPNDAPEIIQLSDLEKEYHRLAFLVDDANAHIKKELEVSIKAGEIVGVLYDKILAQYKDPESLESQKALNKLCVRLVFCLYAEDAGIFGSKSMFHDYMAQFSATDFRMRLIELFRVLDIKPEDRDPYMDEKLAAFPYVNGGMFSGDIEIPRINEEIRDLILQRASDDFDWSLISPTIFGAVFESTLNPETRRAGGMHYTSIENIHKVIDPLFLDGLKAEFAEIKASTVAKTKKDKALAFQNKLAKLKFLDPACGSGNFLTESYMSLRRLENEVLRILFGDNRLIGEIADPIKVSINQFYGIEINDFACAVAQTALWIAESQMMMETDEIVGFNLDPLPLRKYTNIREGNALRMSWSEWDEPDDSTTVYADEVYLQPYQATETTSFVANEPEVRYGTIELYSPTIHPMTKPKRTRHVDFDYIMGNPPFVGASMMTAVQKEDAVAVFGKVNLSNSIDYVGAWYYKCCGLMLSNKNAHGAFVSTNSVTQGEQVAALWQPLFDRYNIHIDFAYRTFVWNSEATDKAHVHVVIIGFSCDDRPAEKRIFDKDKTFVVKSISPYLTEGGNMTVASRPKPLCDVPMMTMGNKPTDGGNLILSEEERERLIKKDPNIEPFVRRYIGAKDFINNNEIRYCLWLKDVPPHFYAKSPEVMRRLSAVRELRLNSTAAPTRKSAETPYRFFSSPQTEAPYLIVPRVSSERRPYIPIGMMSGHEIAADSCSIVLNATLFHFGILSSSVHMAWLKVVGGRLKSDFRYSGNVVYNNFPWPNISEKERDAIEMTAKQILEARNLYSESSLAILYDNNTMPIELRRAHRANDAAVLEAYGFPKDASESEIVARLFKMYQELTLHSPTN